MDNAVHFIFDSDHVGEIPSRLYGFYVTSKSLFTEIDAERADISDELGAWILVERDPERIEITQDTIGCFGLFLFRDGRYWAISNSFNHLLDYLRPRHRLTFNKDYADAYLVQGICVNAYGETMIQEIAWLDRQRRFKIRCKAPTPTRTSERLSRHATERRWRTQSTPAKKTMCQNRQLSALSGKRSEG